MLLEKLLYDDYDTPSEWNSFKFRREFIQKVIDDAQSERVSLLLPPDSSMLALHENGFKKRTQFKLQLMYFKDFVKANSIPTGRSFIGKRTISFLVLEE